MACMRGKSKRAFEHKNSTIYNYVHSGKQVAKNNSNKRAAYQALVLPLLLHIYQQLATLLAATTGAQQHRSKVASWLCQTAILLSVMMALFTLLLGEMERKEILCPQKILHVYIFCTLVYISFIENNISIFYIFF